MKQLTLIVLFSALILASCGKRPSHVSESDATIPDSLLYAPYINVLVSNLDSSLIGTKILARGRITHVDSSRKRCMLSNSDSRVRLEAKGNLAGFNRELIGNEVTVYGILREKRFYQTDLLRMKALSVQQLEALQSDTTDAVICDRLTSDLNDINNMYQWTIDNNRSYYSILYIDSEEYTILN